MPSCATFRFAAPILLLALIVQALPAYEGEECPQKVAKLAETYELNSLVRYSCEQGRLLPQFTLPDAWNKGDVLRVPIKGSDAQWVWRVTPSKTPKPTPADRIVEIWYRDPGHEKQNGFAKASVYSRGSYLAISAVVRIKDHSITLSLRSRNDAKTIEFEAYAEEDGQFMQQLVSAQGPSLETIRAEHQQEVDQLLGPLLRTLTHSNLLGPGPADVYRLFSTIEPDSRAVSRIRQLLPDLGSPEPSRRDKASDELATLGRAGVLAAIRWSSATLSPEQRARLTRFIDSHRRRQIINLEIARRDPMLLLECLEDDDPAIRTSAHQALEKVLARPIVFDTTQSFPDRHAAIERIRKSMTDVVPNVIHASDRDQ